MTATADASSPLGNSYIPEPLRVLSELASKLVPVLYETGEKTWPREREYTRRKWGVFGPEEVVRESRPRRFAVLLRRCDLANLRPCWRLEAGGPVEFFEWDQSGRVHGTYGIRYSVISAAPVVDENGIICGFAVNARSSTGGDGTIRAIDARVDSAVFVRSVDANDVISAVRGCAGKPRTEDSRPGMEPTSDFFHVLRYENKTDYFLRRGANQYVGAGWTPASVQDALMVPGARALIIGHPDEPSLTPEPADH